MKGDFSRLDFDGVDNLNGVLHQQGKVLLDSDWNADTHMNLDWHDRAGREIFGAGVAARAGADVDAFKVVEASVDAGGGVPHVNITLLPGRIWADGRLVMLPAAPTPVVRTAEYLPAPWSDLPNTVDSIASGVQDGVILEVWRESVSAFQIPDKLMEPALSGPDTTERIQTGFVLKLARMNADDSCSTLAAKVKDRLANHGTLKVSLQPSESSMGDCPTAERGGYTGLEHALYRIEIARTNTGPTQFKWSRFNGGLVGRAVFDPIAKKARITANLAAIVNSGLSTFYLETVQYDKELGCWRTTFGARTTLNNSNELDLSAAPLLGTSLPAPDASDDDGAVFMRLWDGIAPVADFPVATGTTEPNELTEGIRLEFDPSAQTTEGDYWTCAVRAGGDNSQVLIDTKPPHGIHRHRVALGAIIWNATKTASFDKGEITDCRRAFRPLTDQKVCCTFTVGDGVGSHGDFDSIEEALLHLPRSGGQLCLLPGLHSTNAVIADRSSVVLVGCRYRTKLIPRPGAETQPIITVAHSASIRIEEIDLISLSGTAIEMRDAAETVIRENRIVALVHAIALGGGDNVLIERNKIRMLDKEGGDIAIVVTGAAVRVERNDIAVISADEPIKPNDPNTPDPKDICTDERIVYGRRNFVKTYVENMWRYVDRTLPSAAVYTAPGGIQVGAGSRDVKIIENRIDGGSGIGISLGSRPERSPEDQLGKKDALFVRPDTLGEKEATDVESISRVLYNLSMDGNDITHMGLCGIGVAAYYDVSKVPFLISVLQASITRNHIAECLAQTPHKDVGFILTRETGLAGISLADATDCSIRGNRIEHNGAAQRHPVSGVFVLYGENIDISENQIRGNGPAAPTRNELDRVGRGVSAGIYVGMSLKTVLQTYDLSRVSDVTDAVPAATIHDNTVVQPLGQALFLVALGPISVTNNSFTSQGADVASNPISAYAASVFILDLGIAKDMVRLFVAASFRHLARANDKAMAVDRAKTRAARFAAGVSTDSAAENARLRRLALLPGGSVLFANNRVLLDLRAPAYTRVLTSQIIASLDDIGYLSNQSECASLRDVVTAHTLLGGITVRTEANRFQEGLTTSLISLTSLGVLNTALGNQATHCIHVYGTRTINQHNMVADSTWCEEMYAGVGKKLTAFSAAIGASVAPSDEVVTRRLADETDRIDASYTALDSMRIENLDLAQQVQSARRRSLAREYDRTSTGAAAPTSRILSTRISYAAAVDRGLREEAAASRGTVADFKSNTIAIQGRVLTARGAAAKAMHVTIVDEQGTTIAEGVTDAHGSYALNVAADPAAATDGAYVVRVSDSAGTEVSRDALVLSRLPGSAVYREIALAQAQPAPQEQWRVHGIVLNRAGAPIAGVTVSVYDRDVRFDDFLGSSPTDEKGAFSVAFTRKDFDESGEEGPDIYIRVFDSNKRLLYSSETRVRKEAGKDETFAIRL